MTAPQPPHQTHWTVVLAAADGDPTAREAFAARYLPVARAYLGARWRGRPQMAALEDAVQEILTERLRDDGGVAALDRETKGSFRTFLADVVRGVAERTEAKEMAAKIDDAATAMVEATVAPSTAARLADEAQLRTVFDQAWARSIMQETADRLAAAAQAAGGAPARRSQLLHLHYHERQPLEQAAEGCGIAGDAAEREMALARAEFATILRRVVAERESCNEGELDRWCAELLVV
ncbi:MAG: hypothetical protein AAF628_13705 [Planctomycetota bacterium]